MLPATPRGRLRWTLAIGAIAVLVGLLHVLPALLIAARPSPPGQTYLPAVRFMQVPGEFEEVLYAVPCVEEVREGRWRFGDCHSFEHKNDAQLFAYLPVWIAAVVSWPLDSPAGLCPLGDALFPPLAFLCVYLLFRRAGAGRATAAAAGLLALLGPDLLRTARYLMRGPSPLDPSRTTAFAAPLQFCRLYNPQIAWPILGLGLLALTALARRPTALRAGLAAAALAANSYTDLYDALFVFTAAGLWAGLAALRGDGRQARLFAAAIAAGGALSAGFAVSVLRLRGLPAYAEYIERYGLKPGRPPWVDELMIALAVAAATWPRGRPERPAVVVFTLAVWFCTNLLLVFGMDLQNWHWRNRVWGFLALPVLLGWAAAWVGRLSEGSGSGRLMAAACAVRRHAGGLYAGFATTLLALGAVHQAGFAAERDAAYRYPRGLVASLQWLRSEAPPDSVVLTLDPTEAALVPALTGCNLYVPCACWTPCSNAETAERLGDGARVLGLGSDDLRRRLEKVERLGRWILYELEDPRRRELLEAALRTAEARSRAPVKFRLDFVLVGPDAAADAPRVAPLRAERVFEQDGYRLFRIRTPG